MPAPQAGWNSHEVRQRMAILLKKNTLRRGMPVVHVGNVDGPTLIWLLPCAADRKYIPTCLLTRLELLSQGVYVLGPQNACHSDCKCSPSQSHYQALGRYFGYLFKQISAKRQRGEVVEILGCDFCKVKNHCINHFSCFER